MGRVWQRWLPVKIFPFEVAMNQADFRAATPYAELGNVVAAAPEDVRRTFIRKTYTHLAGAIYAFVMLTWLFVQLGWDDVALRIIGNNQLLWLAVLAGFMFVGWIANAWRCRPRQSASSMPDCFSTSWQKR